MYVCMYHAYIPDIIKYLSVASTDICRNIYASSYVYGCLIFVAYILAYPK